MKRTLLAVGSILLVTACSTVDDGAIPEGRAAKVTQALCLDPNDPNTCFNCAYEQECPGDYGCDPETQHCIAFCTDGYWSGDEGDVDCGGVCAYPAWGSKRCAAGKHCWTNWDCQSNFCYYDVCQ